MQCMHVQFPEMQGTLGTPHRKRHGKPMHSLSPGGRERCIIGAALTWRAPLAPRRGAPGRAAPVMQRSLPPSELGSGGVTPTSKTPREARARPCRTSAATFPASQ